MASPPFVFSLSYTVFPGKSSLPPPAAKKHNRITSFPWLSGQFLPTENPHTPVDSSQTMAAIPYKTRSQQEDENEKEIMIMSSKNSNKLNSPQARAAMDKFKMEAASEVGVNLKDGYNGDLTSRQAGSVGGQMVKKMIESYEKNL